MGERMAAVETWQSDHERRCDDRQKTMGREIGELKTATRGLTKGAWALMISLLAWALVQLYGQLQRPVASPVPVAAAANKN